MASSLPTAGLFIIDKPLGRTSHDVVNGVRRVVKQRRVGHAGTLDPAASGVLLVAFGLATRYLEYVMAEEKEYDAVVRLGIETDTYDLDGQVTSQQVCPEFSELDVLTAMAPLTGRILQLPPMYSAIKVDGVPLHRLARKGQDILRQPREVDVRRFELVGMNLPDVEVSITCSKGTYVRSLAHDLGKRLGCGGALAALRRVRSGRFHVDDAVPLDELRPEHAHDINRMLEAMPAVRLPEADLQRFRAGNRVDAPEADEGTVRVLDAEGRFHGVGEKHGPRLRPRKILAASALES